MRYTSVHPLMGNAPVLAKAAVIRQGATRLDPWKVTGFFAVHIPVALLMRWNPFVSVAHAVLTLLVGAGVIWFARDRSLARLTYVLAYVTGCEILWRGTQTTLFWELGKYAIGALAIMGVLRHGRIAHVDKKPVLYFLLLLPSLLVLPVFDRQGIAFNLSGPFALAALAAFFSTITLDRRQLFGMLAALLAPIVGLGFVSMFGMLGTEAGDFTGVSTSTTTAGIGPNQVASILGLGVFVAFYYGNALQRYRTLRVMAFMAALWLATGTVLSFSRGGFWTALAAIAASCFYLIQDRRSRAAFLVGGVAVCAVGYLVVFPAVDAFTGGLLKARYESFDTVGRDEIILADLVAFTENPILGLGPGQSKSFHAEFFRRASAHTEYSRLLAEHGTLGLLALVLLGWMSVKCLRRRLPPLEKAFIAGCVVWSLLFMAHSAMRLAAPAFVFGLASVTIVQEMKPNKDKRGRLSSIRNPR